MDIQDKPLAIEGLKSYRYQGPFGWIMIGAVDETDALKEAKRSTAGAVTREWLQEWTNGEYRYV